MSANDDVSKVDLAESREILAHMLVRFPTFSKDLGAVKVLSASLDELERLRVEQESLKHERDAASQNYFEQAEVILSLAAERNQLKTQLASATLPEAFLAEHARVVAQLEVVTQQRKAANASRDAAWNAREAFMKERDVLQTEVAAMQPVVDAAARLHAQRFMDLEVTTKLAAVVVDRYKMYERRKAGEQSAFRPMPTGEHCPHIELYFASGWFYVICSMCSLKWVACSNDADRDIHHARRGAGRGCSAERRFKSPPQAADITMNAQGLMAAADAGLFKGLHDAGYRVADAAVEEDPTIGVLQSELATANERIVELEAELARERRYMQEAIDGIRNLGAAGVLQSFMTGQPPATEPAGARTAQIATGDVDEKGELELILDVDGAEGSVWISQEFWEAVAVKARWRIEDG